MASRTQISQNVMLTAKHEVLIYEKSRKTGTMKWKKVGEIKQATINGSLTAVFCLKPGTIYFYKEPQRIGLHKEMVDALIGHQIEGTERSLTIEWLYYPGIEPKNTNGTRTTDPVWDGIRLFATLNYGNQYALFGNSVEYWTNLETFKPLTLTTLEEIK